MRTLPHHRPCRALLIAALLGATPAFSCPPASDSQALQAAYMERMEQYREEIIRSAAIMYGVVETEISRDETGPVYGRFRIIHVYRGPYRVGQSVRLAAGRFPVFFDCAMPPFLTYRAGQFGVIVLWPPGHPRSWRRLDGFLPDEMVQSLIDDGVIRSAQASTAREQP